MLLAVELPPERYAGQSILQGRGSDLSSSTATVVVMPGDMARITVTGTALSILPGMSLPVGSVEVGPIQEFRGSE